MKILVATNNKNKLNEIAKFYKNDEILGFGEIMEPFEAVENGSSFKQNAFIKARAVFDKLSDRQKSDFIVLSDDSGICVDALGGAPGIFSARFSGVGATDAQNRQKLIAELHRLNLTHSKAYFIACVAICSKFSEFCAYGVMNGKVINKEWGNNGFGYDFLFVPNGFNKTIGELDESVKLEISHRSKALKNAQYLIKLIKKSVKFYKKQK